MMPKALTAKQYQQMKTDACMDAFDKMNYSEQQVIIKLANILQAKCPRLSREGALEILGKMGMNI